VDEELIANLMSRIEEVGHVPMPGGYPDPRAWTMDCPSFRSAPEGAARSLVCLALLGEKGAMGRRSALRPRWTSHADHWLESNAQGLGAGKKLARATGRRHLLEAMFRIVNNALPGGSTHAIQFRAWLRDWAKRAAEIELPARPVPLGAAASGSVPLNTDWGAFATSLAGADGPRLQAVCFLQALQVLLDMRRFDRTHSDRKVFYKGIATVLLGRFDRCELTRTAGQIVEALAGDAIPPRAKAPTGGSGGGSVAEMEVSAIEPLAEALEAFNAIGHSAWKALPLADDELPAPDLVAAALGAGEALSRYKAARDLAGAVASTIIDPMRVVESPIFGRTFYEYLLSHYRGHKIVTHLRVLFDPFADGSIQKSVADCLEAAAKVGTRLGDTGPAPCVLCSTPPLVRKAHA